MAVRWCLSRRINARFIYAARETISINLCKVRSSRLSERGGGGGGESHRPPPAPYTPLSFQFHLNFRLGQSHVNNFPTGGEVAEFGAGGLPPCFIYGGDGWISFLRSTGKVFRDGEAVKNVSLLLSAAEGTFLLLCSQIVTSHHYVPIQTPNPPSRVDAHYLHAEACSHEVCSDAVCPSPISLFITSRILSNFRGAGK